MRVAYLIVGIFLGGLFVLNTSNAVIDYMTVTFEREISVYTLVGFYEGWSRGRDYTVRYLGWQLNDCLLATHGKR